MNKLLNATTFLIFFFCGTSIALASECNGTNVLGTWRRQASEDFTNEAVWTFLQDSTNTGTIECSGDCIREGGAPVSWITPGDFFDQPGMIKIVFERAEVIFGCDMEGEYAMVWTLNGATAMRFARE